jgi:hypothetical protein
MNKLKTTSPWWEFSPILAAREPFTSHGNLYSSDDGFYPLGRLPGEHHASLKRADYVVYSYSTPIAWHTEDGWVMPDEKYSVTTSRHQSRIRTALTEIGALS